MLERNILADILRCWSMKLFQETKATPHLGLSGFLADRLLSHAFFLRTPGSRGERYSGWLM